MMPIMGASKRNSMAKAGSITKEPAERVRTFGSPPTHHLHAGERKRHVPAPETPQRMKIVNWTKSGAPK